MTTREVERVRAVLTPDLLHPRYRDRPRAYCYPATEALFHLLSSSHNVEVWRQRLDSDTVHWYLRVDGRWVDPTADQFDEGPPTYAEGARTGFLTKAPSKRAAEILRRIACTE